MKRVIYHSPCSDGFAGCLAAWKRFGNEDVDYLGWGHGDLMPADAYIEEGDEVYVIDLTFPRDVLLDWYDKAETLVVLDHHKTGLENVGDLEFVQIDMKHSGAYMAWEYFHPEEEIPEIIKYVEDKDLWKWELPDSKEINAAIESYPFDFDIWNSWLIIDHWNRHDETRASLFLEGEVALRMKDRIIERLMEHIEHKRFDEFEVPSVNTSLFPSEIGHELLQLFPDAPFAMTHYNRQGREYYSFRSEDHREDVSLLAERYNGGGHRNASGGRIYDMDNYDC